MLGGGERVDGSARGREERGGTLEVLRSEKLPFFKNICSVWRHFAYPQRINVSHQLKFHRQWF